MTARLEAWFWADFDSCRTIRVSENGADWYDFTIGSHRIATAALSAWQGLANVHGSLSNTYTFEYVASETDPTVSLSATGSFYVEMPYSLNVALGFASGQLGPATSFTSTTTPAAICTPINIFYHVPEPLESISSDRFRWGRTKAHVFTQASTVKLRQVMLDRAAAANVDNYGALFQGRVRAYTDDTAASAYASDDLDGYMDLYPFRVGEVGTIGTGDRLMTVEVDGTL